MRCFNVLTFAREITDLVEIGRTDTFPYYIPVCPNTANVFVVKELKKRKCEKSLTHT